MRRLAFLPLLFVSLFLASCDDVSGLGSRDLDGEWVAWVEGEEVWFSVRDNRGSVRGSGEWGFDGIYVTGDRYHSEVWLRFEFGWFNPIEFEGEIRGRELRGRLYGSGYDGVRVRFRRE